MKTRESLFYGEIGEAKNVCSIIKFKGDPFTLKAIYQFIANCHLVDSALDDSQERDYLSRQATEALERLASVEVECNLDNINLLICILENIRGVGVWDD